MRRLFVIPAGLFILLAVGLLLGFAAQLPFFLVVSLICTGPMFLLGVGYAFGKASNRYTFFVPKETAQLQPQPRSRRPAAATYEVSNGDMRGN